MLVAGKRPRPRPTMRRTTSMTGITVDVITNSEEADSGDASDHHRHLQGSNVMPSAAEETAVVVNGGYDRRFLAMLSPRNRRRNGSDFLETSHFLGTCGFCKRRLAPGRDIYMYKGDAAFCSVECREQQMERDETKN